jgi:hypothetical protein
MRSGATKALLARSFFLADGPQTPRSSLFQEAINLCLRNANVAQRSVRPK